MSAGSTVTLDAPELVSFEGPVPLSVTLRATMETFYATNGIIDHALEVVMVRRDAPGVRFLSKVDPAALMLPDKVLVADPEQLASGANVVESRVFSPLDYDVSHPGAARYFVFACFAHTTTPPRSLTVTHPDETLPWPRHLLPPSQGAADAPSDQGLVASVTARGGLHFVEGVVRSAAIRRLDRQPLPLFVSVVGSWLRAGGGTRAACFELFAERVEGDVVGHFEVPLAQVMGSGGTGTFRVQVFADDHIADAVDIEVG